MIAKGDLLDLFERMAREKWAYEWGAAREGCVDCSGAFVYAYGQLGGPAIAHGSNSILRQSMGALVPMEQARPGYAAVKIRAWKESERGNRWYGQEPGDCYHIGLVGRDGKILNAQGAATGFVKSDPQEGFTACAPLCGVCDDGEAERVLYRATVNTQRDPLRIRQAAVSGKVLGTAPRGAAVDVLADSGDGWPRVRYCDLSGYACGAYLSRVEEREDALTAGGEATRSTTLARADGVRVTLCGEWRIAEDG